MEKNRFFVKVLLAAFSVASLAGLVGLQVTKAAGSATLTLTPSSGSFVQGQEFTVAIHENSGDDGVNAVQADLSYNAAHLEFRRISVSGSAFPYSGEETLIGGGGNVRIGVGSASARTGRQKVADVTFRVLQDSGTATISFSGSSAIVRMSDVENVWNGSTAGASFTMVPPPSNPPASGGGSNSGGSSNNSGGSGGNSANNQGGSQQSGAQNQNPQAPPLADDQPVPVASEGEASGYLVAVQVLDGAGEVVADTEVTLGDQKAQTDATGIASFVGVQPGDYTIAALGQKLQITVREQDSADVQNFVIQQQPKGAGFLKSWMIFTAGGLVILAAGGIVLQQRLKAGNKTVLPVGADAVVGNMQAPPQQVRHDGVTSIEPTVVQPNATPESPAGTNKNEG